MIEQQRYEQVDMPFYKERIVPLLPNDVLDFHTHIWRSDQWVLPVTDEKSGDAQDISMGSTPHSKYMVVTRDYTIEQLIEDGRIIFPDNRFHAVAFGQPGPLVDTDLTNDYVIRSVAHPRIYPLRVTGNNMTPKDVIKQQIIESGFWGYKVYLNWIGDDYGHVRIEDMLGHAEMELADELGLIVLWHVPRSRRLADPEIQRGVRDYAKAYPNAKIVLAHCGRCYLPEEMKSAIDSVIDLPNVYFDTAMVMEPVVMHMIFDNINSNRVLFATDFPVARMRGRRVYVMDHWVDLVIDGYPPSAFRVGSDNIRASFMAYEIVLAIAVGGKMAGLTEQQIRDVYYNNGMKLLDSARTAIAPRERNVFQKV